MHLPESIEEDQIVEVVYEQSEQEHPEPLKQKGLDVVTVVQQVTVVDPLQSIPLAQ